MRLLLPVVCVLALSACTATKESQVRSSLVKAGLPRTTADCMAQPMARELSVGQLQSLSRVSDQVSGKGRALSARQFLDILRRDVDSETVGVVTRAGLGCMMRG